MTSGKLVNVNVNVDDALPQRYGRGGISWMDVP